MLITRRCEVACSGVVLVVCCGIAMVPSLRSCRDGDKWETTSSAPEANGQANFKEFQDVLRQIGELQRSRDEDVKASRREVEKLRQKLQKQRDEFDQQLAEVQQERDNVLQAMVQEGKELQARISTLTIENEALTMLLQGTLRLSSGSPSSPCSSASMEPANTKSGSTTPFSCWVDKAKVQPNFEMGIANGGRPLHVPDSGGGKEVAEKDDVCSKVERLEDAVKAICKKLNLAVEGTATNGLLSARMARVRRASAPPIRHRSLSPPAVSNPSNNKSNSGVIYAQVTLY